MVQMLWENNGHIATDGTKECTFRVCINIERVLLRWSGKGEGGRGYCNACVSLLYEVIHMYIRMYLYVFLYCCCSCDFFNASLQIEKSPDKIPLRVCQYIYKYMSVTARVVYTKVTIEKWKELGFCTLSSFVYRYTFFNVPMLFLSISLPSLLSDSIENSVMNVRWFCARASRGPTFVYMYLYIYIYIALYIYIHTYNTFISMRNSHCVFVYTRMIGSHL